jgi:Ca-activated chloride channel family protein
MTELQFPFDIIYGIVAIVIWSIAYWGIIKRPELTIPKKFVSTSNRALRIAVFLIGLIGLGLITYSLTGPRLPLGFADNTKEVNDIFFVIDISRSMEADDFAPNRLEVAKQKIEEFIKLRPKDRIGIIMFSEKAFTLLPLTTDNKLIKEMIKQIRTGLFGGGTNIGDALGLAVARGAQSLAENKVIILLTDGVSNFGNMTPLDAAEQASNEKMKVYTIGIGGKKDARIPVGRGVFGMQYQKIPGGSIDLNTLQKISKMTGGKSYSAADDQALKNVFADIDKLERTEIKSSGKMIYKELYYVYLFWGFLLFVFSEGIRAFILKEPV